MDYQEYAITLSYQTPHQKEDYEPKLKQIRDSGCRFELLVHHTGETRGFHYHGILITPKGYKYSQLYDHGQNGMNVEIKRMPDKYGWIQYCYHEQPVYSQFITRTKEDDTLTMDQKVFLQRMHDLKREFLEDIKQTKPKYKVKKTVKIVDLSRALNAKIFMS